MVSAAETAWRNGAWVAGFLSYEAAPALDPALQTQPPGPLPLAWFAVFDRPAPPGPPDRPESEHRVGEWVPEWDARAHAVAVEQVREAIAAGETYQLNLTHRLRARFEGDGLQAWEAIQRAQRGAMGAWLDLGRFQIGSASPELFFRWDGERLVTRPMKGTSTRGPDVASDRSAAERLQRSVKERAENAMIVDLLRNDLGRVARPGSVRVERLHELERYPTVWQLTSTVSARTREGCGLWDVLAALFPCGSITGAPKVRTMQRIRELEPSPRGLYCGTIGLLCPDGTASFNVAIRTMVIDRERGVAEYGTGGGITWDSRAAEEWRETQAKARVLEARAPDFELLETLRLEDGAYPRGPGHLSRLLHSSELLGFDLQEVEVRELLENVAGAHPRGARMVRLTARHPVAAVGRPAAAGREVAPDAPAAPSGPGDASADSVGIAQDFTSHSGRVRAQVRALPRTPERPRVALHREPLALEQRAHKTTHRAPFERALAAHPDAWDVLLCNAAGELTEFTRGNLVVVVADGRALTPPLSAGLLPGTMRAQLLAEGRIAEQTLLPADLVGARSIRFVNDLRGVVEVELIEERVDAPSQPLR